MWIIGSGLVGRVVPSTSSSCFRTSSSGRHRARSAIWRSTPSVGTCLFRDANSNLQVTILGTGSRRSHRRYFRCPAVAMAQPLWVLGLTTRFWKEDSVSELQDVTIL